MKQSIYKILVEKLQMLSLYNFLETFFYYKPYLLVDTVQNLI